MVKLLGVHKFWLLNMNTRGSYSGTPPLPNPLEFLFLVSSQTEC